MSSVSREFCAKLLVLLLVFQFTVAHGQVTSQPVKPSVKTAAPPRLSPPPAAASPSLQHAALGSKAFARLAKGALPRYMPVAPEDPADPYIVAQAAALNDDPNQIFAFVRDQIGFEAYVGSVRGARGTLWAMAGNSLDKSSLLVALLGAAGFTAEYEHANIDGTPAQQTLILSMFPPVTTFVGCIPPTALPDNPLYNAAADQGSADYYWVMYGSNGTNDTALDPNVAGAQPNQTFQTSDSSFTSVPQALRQQVTVKVNAETYSQGAVLFGGGPSTNTVLSQSFDASALVGNIISVGNLVSGSGGGGLDLTATTFTYTPFLLIGSGGGDISQDQLITGTPYQELFTNFPLSSQILTGLFLEIDADDITQSQQVYTRTLFDRLGPAARSGNASVSLNVSSTPAPALTQFDLTTVNINTARQPASSIQTQRTRLGNAYNNYEAFKAQLATLPTAGPLNGAQMAILEQGTNLGEYLTIAENELITMSYDYTADQLAQQLQTGYFSRVYPNSPRITIASTAYNGGNTQEMLDVFKNDMQVIDGVGQNHTTPYNEEIARGMIESLVESTTLNQATGQTNAIGIGEVFAALGDPNKLVVVGPQTGQTPSNTQVLNTTTLSADAQALILEDVAAGNVVMAPNQMVTINGLTTVGWWVINPATGHMISHFVNGGHQAIAEEVYADVLVQLITSNITLFIGRVEGFGAAGFQFTADILTGVALGNLKVSKSLLSVPPAILGQPEPSNTPPLRQFFDFASGVFLQLAQSYAAKEYAANAAAQFGLSVYGLVGALGTYTSGLVGGYYDAIKWFTANLPMDPDALDFISTPLGLHPTTPTPGTLPGVQVGAITVDPTYTMPINGNSLPLVFDVPITNTGPSTDTFKIQVSNGSSYFSIYPTVNSLTLAGGQSGMVNMCVFPYDSTGATMPPVGQTQNYSIGVTSTTNPSVTASVAPSFNAPPVPSLELTTDPPTVSTTPGGSTTANLTLASVGNVATGPVALTLTLPAGLTISGLASPLTVPLNGSATEPLQIHAAANMASGNYQIGIQASYTPAGGAAQFSYFPLGVSVTPLGGCALSAATTAAQLRKTTLATDLTSLAADMDTASTNPALATRVVGDMNNIITGELTTSYFQSIIPNLTAATNGVAAATPSTLTAALSTLSTAVCSIGTLLNQANTTSTFFTLRPSSALAGGNLAVGPNQSAQWNLSIQNTSPVLHTYDLSTTGVPAGVTVQFSQPKITLPPYPSALSGSFATLLTLTTGATFNTPFSFNVVATPEDAPEFAVSASGTLLARPESISVDQVTASPAYGPSGTQFTVSARVFAVVNEPVQATLQLTVTDPNGKGVCCGSYSNQFTLTPSTSVQTITLLPLSTTNYINGVYTLSVQAESGGTPQGPPATGTLLIGAPLSGVLSASPQVVAPGSSTVQASLNITRDLTSNPIATLVGSVQLNGVARTMTLFQNGAQQLAYVCADSQVNIVDVTNTAKPQVLGTFANDILTTENGGSVLGYQVVACSTYTSGASNYLLISYSRYDGNTTANPIPTHFATYSLANPLAPTMVGSVMDISRGDSAGLYVAGNTALMYQSTTFYNPYDQFLNGFTGDIWAADLSHVSTGAVSYLNDVYSCGTLNGTTCSNTTNVPTATYTDGVCTPGAPMPIPNDPTRGGPYRISQGTAVNATTTYFASSDSYDGNVLNPSCPQINGQLLVVDTSTPSAPTIVTSVPDPAMAFISGIAVQGKTAIAVGDSIGIYDINSGYYGTLVISAFDITNPQNPTLVSSISTQLKDMAGSFVVPLGNNTFAVGNTTLNGKAELVLVDASDTSALRYIPYDAPIVANPTIAQNGSFFALSATPAATQNAISVFQLTQVTGPQLSVSLDIANTANAAPVAGSFIPPPTSSTPGSGFTTYVWNQPGPNTITWNMSLTGVNPGDVTTLVNDGQMNFTLPSLGSGMYPLGSLSVLTQHILSISPANVNLNYTSDTANYTATISNPTNGPQTFSLSAIVPPGFTGTVPPTVTVPANGSQTFNVAIMPASNAQGASYTFNVAAAAGGIGDTAPATVGVSSNGPNVGGNDDTRFIAFNSSIVPAQLTVGQGDYSLPFTITIANTGNFAFYIQANPALNLPNGASVGSYVPTYYAQPAPNQSSSFSGSVFAQRGTTPGTYPITIPVQAGNTIENLGLSVKVSGAGVLGYLSPNPATPSSTVTLNLTNSGLAQDTFNLSVLGPLAQAASLPATVTIAAGATNPSIPITIDTAKYIVPADSQLQIRAVSQNDPNVFGLISGTVTVPPVSQVTASIQPGTTSVNSNPATVNLTFNAANTGNVLDTYTAQITGTTGPATAALVDANGSSGQSVGQFIIPARGNAQFPLNATVTGSTKSTVTVAVTSVSTPGVTSSATVTINGPTASTLPTANAGTGGNTPEHRLALLNGSLSSDTNTPPLSLSYAWSLVSAPGGSAVTSASIAFPNASLAAFRPDVAGAYTFKLTVTTTAGSNSANVTYTAVDAIPIAITGNNFNAGTGTFAFLDGKNSYDPDGQPITFAWTLVSAPAGSGVTSQAIGNAQTARPFFTPDVTGAYQFKLIVSDASAASLPALVTVTAYSGTIAPNADAGRDQNTGLHAAVTVNGGKSSDPNASPLPLNYQWMLATAPTGSTASLTGASSVSAQFTPDLPGDYQLSLTVSNANGTSGAATTTVHAFAGDVPPNANAGGGQFVLPNSTVTLNSTASADPDSGPLNLAFLWWLNSLPTGSSATLQQPTGSTPTFVADQSGYYIGRVEANDGLLAGFANTLVTSAGKCDADANGAINQTDIQLITAAIGQTAAANDPRDADASGTITQADVTYCVNLVNQNSPVLQLNPTSFSENLVAGSPQVTKQIQVSSSGNPISFTVSSNQPWLTASVTSGSTSSISTLNAIVTPGNLTANTYQGMLTFTPTVGLAQTVSVTLTLSAAVFTVTPSAVTINNVEYNGTFSQPLQVASSGGPIAFTVQSDQPWLTSDVTSGSTGTTSIVNAIVNDTGLAGSTFQGNLTFTPAGGPAQKVAITMTITPAATVTAAPGTLTFNATYGGSAPPGQTVNVTAASATNFVVTSDSPWLPVALTATTGVTPDPYTVAVNPGGMLPGTYHGVMTFASGLFTSKVNVTLIIAEGTGGSPCDVNQDSKIDVADVQKLINEALGALSAANDLNSDRIVNAVDLQIDINAVLGLGCSAH